MRGLLLALLLATPTAAQDAASLAPFPPGDGALLAKQICTHCHAAGVVVGKHFDVASAQHYWRVMVGTDIESADARKVIGYLSTVLGYDDVGPDAAVR